MLIAQLSVPQGETISGNVGLFIRLAGETEATLVPVELFCSEPVGCNPGDRCDDGNPCTEGDTCDDNGECQPGTPVDCSDQGDQCNDASCDQGGAVGNCDVQMPKPDGTTCEDGNACTEKDVCTGGVCSGDKIGCDDNDPCTDESCDPASGCVHTPNNDPCDDGDPCTENDTCSGGVCSGERCPPGTACVEGECVEITEIELFLDMKPRQCPNKLMRGTHAAVWAAVLGTEDFDITQLSLEGITLQRADGGGGALAPRNLKFKDEATPFEGNDCGCHVDGRDGIRDLKMKFKTEAIVEALELEDVPNGDQVEVTVTGTLLDGTPFSSSDCLLIMRPGG